MGCAGGVRPELQVPALRGEPASCRCRRKAHTRPMEVRSSKLHGAPALPATTGCPSEWPPEPAKTAR